MVLASVRGSAYQDHFERAIARMAHDEQARPVPAGIAMLLHKVIKDSNPRLRYTTGPAAQRAAGWLKRTMPYAIVEKIMQLYYIR